MYIALHSLWQQFCDGPVWYIKQTIFTVFSAAAVRTMDGKATWGERRMRRCMLQQAYGSHAILEPIR